MTLTTRTPAPSTTGHDARRAPGTEPAAASEARPAEETAGRTTTRIAVVVGSIRHDRFCLVPAEWIRDRAGRHEGLEVDLIDLSRADLPVVLGGNDPEAEPPRQVAELGRRLEAADAFVIVTPVYNRSYPASLKNAIDWFYTEFQLKPVGFVSYGGTFGGIEAVEALRSVFAEFSTVTLADPIAFPNFWDAFDHDGRPVDGEAAARSATRFLDQLQWFSDALRLARARRPYPFGDAE